MQEEVKKSMNGELLLGKKKRFWFVIFAAVLAFIFLEAGVRITKFLFRAPGPWDRPSLALYPDKKMAYEFYRERDEDPLRYNLLSGWGRKEYHGKYFNINSDGTRKTWNPNVLATSSRAIKIFTLGGSAMWGDGVADEFTIPSLLSKTLNSGSGREFVVSNYAEGGFVLLQEIARLTILLESGARPDYVIFYDGANDVAFSYQIGEGGTEGMAKFFEGRFEEYQRPALTVAINYLKDALKNACQACRVPVDLARIYWPGFLRPAYQVQGYRVNEDRIPTLAKQIADNYKGNYLAYLNRLSETFRFKLIALFQPTLLTDPKRIGEEDPKIISRWEPQINDMKLAELYRKTYALLKTDPKNNFYNLYDVLADRTRECYMDNAHTSGECNALIAKRIADIIAKN